MKQFIMPDNEVDGLLDLLKNKYISYKESRNETDTENQIQFGSMYNHLGYAKKDIDAKMNNFKINKVGNLDKNTQKLFLVSLLDSEGFKKMLGMPGFSATPVIRQKNQR